MIKSTPSFAILLEGFFTQRLIKQRCVSPHTIKSYRDTFRLLLHFVKEHLKKEPSKLDLSEIDAPLIAKFLQSMEKDRNISARSRNLRLTAIRSFFRYAALEAPANSAQIQRVLAMPSKRFSRPLLCYLTHEEIKAFLAASDLETWKGRRDHALCLVAVHTGLRLSELIAARIKDVILDTGSHIRVVGKGRKERCTPLTKQTTAILKSWMRELLARGDTQVLFPNTHGTELSADAVQYIIAKLAAKAGKTCPSLVSKRVTPHVLRHTAAMELLQAGADISMIALWLGHESIETTQIYLHANFALKEQILAKTSMPQGQQQRYRADDRLLDFLASL